MTKDQPRPTFEELWASIVNYVRAAVSRHRSRDVALAADDLVQEVRIRVWTIFERDRNSTLNTSYYLRVVNSAIIDSLRKHRGTLAHAQREENDESSRVEEVGHPEPGPEARFEEAARAERLRSAIGSLPPDRARAIGLFLQGFTVPEIAELMHCDPNRAHNLTYRGMNALKKIMSDDQ